MPPRQDEDITDVDTFLSEGQRAVSSDTSMAMAKLRWVIILLVGGISGLLVALMALNLHGPASLADIEQRSHVVEGIRPDSARSRPARGGRNQSLSTEELEPSPYEELWPKFKLPGWATKVGRLRAFKPPGHTKMCYVHVGKTAGSSIGCALGFRLHCGGGRQDFPGRLPKAATHIFHQNVYNCPEDTDLYLFVVRDPLARARSAFVYGRLDENGLNPRERQYDNLRKIYMDCPYQTMDDLAWFGLSEEGPATQDCKQRAKELLRGTARYENHLFFNYQFYLESVPPGSKLLVIRTEHMLDDWNNIEIGLGGQPQSNLTFPRDNSQAKQDRDLILGDEEKILICHELCVEILVYKFILRNSLNINRTHYETSIKELEASCPNEAHLDKCSFEPPDISDKLYSQRGYLPEDDDETDET